MQTKIYRQHEEHEEWKNKIAFYQDEVRIMQSRLLEVAARNTGKDVMKEVEHFQNQFIIQSRNLLELKDEIQLSEARLTEGIRNNPVAADHRSDEDHLSERNAVTAFDRSFHQLRDEFMVFLAKTL